MSATASVPKNAEPNSATTAGRLFFLDLSGGRILSSNPDGSDLKAIISEGRKLPDGLALDLDPVRNDGSIMRSDLNGSNVVTIVPPGVRLRRSSSNWRIGAASFIGLTAKACA
jgi:hypothetical protein